MLDVQRVRRFIIIGGGETGVFYVRQLRRAVEAGRLQTEAIVVVDLDPSCLAAEVVGGAVRLEISAWSDWLFANLDADGAEDHLVPYHWAPHLLIDWLRRHAEAAGAEVGRDGELGEVGTPFERVTGDGGRALSFATWLCPPTCIEPDLCPHTRGPKDWSLAERLSATEGRADEALVFPCLHLIYAVATIPIATILAARERLLDGLAAGSRSYLVATASHCHGLAARLMVTAGPTASRSTPLDSAR